MNEVSLDQKYTLAAKVICKQGTVPFPVNDTTISILKLVIEDNEEELDFIYAFRQNASQTMEELKKSSNLPEKKIEQLATGLAKKGLIFNQPNSAGILLNCCMNTVTSFVITFICPCNPGRTGF